MSRTQTGSCVRLMTSDVKNAFNTASWSAIISELQRRRVSPYLVQAVYAFLQKRVVQVGVAGNTDDVWGTPKIGFGTFFVEHFVRPPFKVDCLNGMTLIEYANNLAMAETRKTKVGLKYAAIEAARIVTQWFTDTGLTLAAHKTESQS